MRDDSKNTRTVGGKILPWDNKIDRRTKHKRNEKWKGEYEIKLKKIGTAVLGSI